MTGQPVTVDATDLHALVVAFATVDQSFRPFLGRMDGYPEAREACNRLAITLAHASGVNGMPPDPVADADAGAIGHHELMMSYERAGFSHGEAFTITLAWVQAAATAGITQALNGGGA